MVGGVKVTVVPMCRFGGRVVYRVNPWVVWAWGVGFRASDSGLPDCLNQQRNPNTDMKIWLSRDPGALYPQGMSPSSRRACPSSAT